MSSERLTSRPVPQRPDNIKTPAKNSAGAKKGQPAKGIQSIEIGYRVLLAVQRGPSPVQLTEIARRAGLSSGAAHNYLVSLGRTGLVEQESRGAYRLGPSAFALSLASFQQLTNYDLMRDATRRLHQATGISAAASVWSQAGPVSVYTQNSEAAGAFEFRTGLIPYLTAAAPRIFTAYLPEEMTRPLIEQELERRNRPKAEAKKIIRQFSSTVRKQGYAITSYQSDLGDEVVAIAAPVFKGKRDVSFTLTLVDMASHIHPKVDGKYLEALLAVAGQATLLLEFSGS